MSTRFSKCFNVYCRGQYFNIDNFVFHRFSDLGIGRIVRKIEVPASKSLDVEDTYFITKFKVFFNNNVMRIIPPIDLVHYIFEVNEKVLTKNGVGVINSGDFLSRKGFISYEVLFPNGKLHQIEESEMLSRYRTPLQALISSNKIDPPENFLIKYWANLFNSYYTSYQIKCITNSRLSLFPHQINVAHRLSEEFFPKLILADEVGLGKTIEAGIYIKEMMARNLADRILIIVPATLAHQWEFEMKNKFNVEFVIYDGKKFKNLKKRGSRKFSALLRNPFYYDNLIICSLQFARNPKYRELLSQISWDIVIFDEAHHLRRYSINASTRNYRETLSYTLAKKMSQNCQSLLLLTATPLQLHSFDLYSLIELIHPEAFENFSDFEHFRKNMPLINLLTTNVREISKLNTFEVKNTLKLLKKLKYVKIKKEDDEILKEIKTNPFKKNLLKKIEADHTLSKFIIRNRKKKVFPKEFQNKRIAKTMMVEPSKQELDVYNEIRLYLAKTYQESINKKERIGLGFVITTLQKLLTSSKHAILKSLERRLEQIERFKNLGDWKETSSEDLEYYDHEYEDEIIDSGINGKIDMSLINTLNQEKILREFCDKLTNISHDSKSEKLLEILKQIHDQNPREKTLIFTQFVDTLFFLKKELEKEGFHVETFYGGLNQQEKDANVEKFRTSNRFAILVSTEIGGEGRNFQFCRILVNYDLPWNPMRLEQRIGRLDRIGQEAREIYIYNFFIDGTIETDIVFALNKRINLFEESIGLLEPIIGIIEKDIKDLIFTENKTEKRKKLNEFYRMLDDQVKKAREIEMQLDDLMIDKKSFSANGLITSLASCEDVKLSHNELHQLIKFFFDSNGTKYGILKDLKQNGEKFKTKIIVKNDLFKHLKHEIQQKYFGTFNIDLARKKEEIDFFALGHPLINAILDYCRNPSFLGTFTVLQVKRNSLPKMLNSIITKLDDIWLFIFDVKFQGYIVENQISSIIIDKKGNEIENLIEFILDIENLSKIFQFKQKMYVKTKFNKTIYNSLILKAKNLVKLRTTTWKQEIKTLNDKIFNQEQNKKKKIYSHKRNVLNIKLKSLKLKLERKAEKRPTERQKQNISNLDDEKKKLKKLEKIKQLEEEINFIEKDIKKIEMKLDELSFEYEDFKNEMIKKNIAKFYANIIAVAIIKFVNF